MTSARPMASLVRKEFRELSTVWLLAMAILVLLGIAGGVGWESSTFGLGKRASDDLAYLSVVAAFGVYALSAVALGALSIGHEYAYRTIGAMLAQPVSRSRVFFVKFGVLVVLVGSLAVLMVTWVPLPRIVAFERRFVALPALFALFLAPFLTMVCRSALAGVVFALVLPVMALQLLGTGFGTLAILVAVPVAAAGVWKMFMELEAIDGRGLEVRVPAWRQTVVRTAETTARRPVWHLVQKELHLQQAPLIVTLLFVAGWIAMSSQPVDPIFASNLRSIVTALHSAIISLLIGSLASAEERQMGTLEWQNILPPRSSLQWAVKVAVCVVLTLVLVIGVPRALLVMLPLNLGAGDLPEILGWQAAAFVSLIAVGSLYVSSFSRSSLYAVLAASALLLAMLVVTAGVVTQVGWWSFQHVLSLLGWVEKNPWYIVKSSAINSLRLAPPFASRLAPIFRLYLETAPVWLALGLAPFLWRFGLSNHRSSDRNTRRVGVQLATIAAAVVLLVLVVAAAFAVYASLTIR